MDSVLAKFPALAIDILVRERLAPWLESDFGGGETDIGSSDTDQDEQTAIDSSDTDEDADEDTDGIADTANTESDDDADQDSGAEDSESGDSDFDEDEDDDYHNMMPHDRDRFVAMMKKTAAVFSRHWPAMKAIRGLQDTDKYFSSLFKITVKWYSKKPDASSQAEELRGSIYQTEEREPGAMQIDARAFVWNTDWFFTTTLWEQTYSCKVDTSQSVL
jgi:hypothetical protein